MNKHGLKLFMLLLLALLVAVACSSKRSDKEGANNKDQLSAAELLKAQETLMNGTNLTVYHPSMSTEDFVNIYGKSIVKRYPDIKIQVLNAKDGDLDEMILTGTNIDIIGGMGYKGETPDLMNLIKKYNYDLNSWDPTVAKYILELNDGKITGIPHTVQTQALFYNKDLFSKFGVPFPHDKMTWDDIQDINKKMTRVDGGVLYWGYNTNYAPNVFNFNQLSLPLIDSVTQRAAFDTDAMKNYMNKMISAVATYGHEVFSGPGSVMDLFNKEQRLAMISMNNTAFRLLSNANSLDWDIAKFPVFPEAPGTGAQPEIPMYYIPSSSKNIEAAFLALVEITAPEAQRDLATVGRVSILRDPAMKTAFGSQPELKGKNVNALVPDRYAVVTPRSDYKSIAAIELGNAYAAVIAGTKDLNTAFRDAVEETNKKIAEMEQMSK